MRGVREGQYVNNGNEWLGLITDRQPRVFVSPGGSRHSSLHLPLNLDRSLKGGEERRCRAVRII